MSINDIYRTKSPRNGQSNAITFVHYSTATGSSACHSNAINAEVVERVINVDLNRILSQPNVIKQIASSVIEELKQKHSKQTEIKYDINSLEKQKAKVKTQQERLLELFLDDKEMDSEMLKAKQSEMNQQLQSIRPTN
ncbi:hypothetical protein ACVXZ0_11590 [Staphylococcus aureus]